MEVTEVQPHIRLSKKQITPVVILVGDPDRVEHAAKLCDHYKELSSNREYRSMECVSGGEKFIIASHGVGSAGATICFQEFIQLGVKALIRAGTCGSLQPRHITKGDIVILHSAVREDGVSNLLIPQGYPAVSSMKVYQSLEESARKLKVSIKSGMTLTSDLFYRSTLLPSSLEMYNKAGVEVTEMETSTLFVLGRTHGVMSGSIVVVDGSPLKWEEGDFDPHGDVVSRAKENMLRTAVDTCVKLTKQLKAEL